MSQPMGVILSCRSVADSEAQCEPNGVRNSGGACPVASRIMSALSTISRSAMVGPRLPHKKKWWMVWLPTM